MCGIIAVIGKYRYKEIPIALIERGRDDNGIFENEHVQLIQTRLHITGEKHVLPFQNKKYVLLFNGEIYNYKDYSSCEYQAILNAFEQGKLKDLDGQFAIIIYNKETNKITVTLDNLRINSLMYVSTEESIIIASNQRSLPNIEIGNINQKGYGNVSNAKFL
jgi:asparagine synthase (glutamine-hydrolysing)